LTSKEEKKDMGNLCSAPKNELSRANIF